MSGTEAASELAGWAAALVAEAERPAPYSLRDGRLLRLVPADRRFESHDALRDALTEALAARPDLLAAAAAARAAPPPSLGRERCSARARARAQAALLRGWAFLLGRGDAQQALLDARLALASAPRQAVAATTAAALAAAQTSAPSVRGPAAPKAAAAETMPADCEASLATSAEPAAASDGDELRAACLGAGPDCSGGGGCAGGTERGGGEHGGQPAAAPDGGAVVAAGDGDAQGGRLTGLQLCGWAPAHELCSAAFAAAEDWTGAAMHAQIACELEPLEPAHRRSLGALLGRLPAAHAAALAVGGAAALAGQLECEREERLPEILRPRPKWHHYNAWMAARISALHPGLPPPVVAKLLAQDAGELDLRLAHPEALREQVDELMGVLQAGGPAALTAHAPAPLTWERVRPLAGPGAVGLPIGYEPPRLDAVEEGGIDATALPASPPAVGPACALSGGGAPRIGG